MKVKYYADKLTLVLDNEYRFYQEEINEILINQIKKFYK
jgi:hypothetical protein